MKNKELFLIDFEANRMIFSKLRSLEKLTPVEWRDLTHFLNIFQPCTYRTPDIFKLLRRRMWIKNFGKRLLNFVTIVRVALVTVKRSLL